MQYHIADFQQYMYSIVINVVITSQSIGLCHYCCCLWCLTVVFHEQQTSWRQQILTLKSVDQFRPTWPQWRNAADAPKCGPPESGLNRHQRPVMRTHNKTIYNTELHIIESDRPWRTASAVYTAALWCTWPTSHSDTYSVTQTAAAQSVMQRQLYRVSAGCAGGLRKSLSFISQSLCHQLRFLCVRLANGGWGHRWALATINVSRQSELLDSSRIPQINSTKNWWWEQHLKKTSQFFWFFSECIVCLRKW